jgi:hypothetical protein
VTSTKGLIIKGNDHAKAPRHGSLPNLAEKAMSPLSWSSVKTSNQSTDVR